MALLGKGRVVYYKGDLTKPKRFFSGLHQEAFIRESARLPNIILLIFCGKKEKHMKRQICSETPLLSIQVHSRA